jgi:hypothetical protein
MKQLKLIPLLLALLLVHLSGSELLCPDYAAPGKAFSLFISGDTTLYEGGEVTIINGEGNIESRSRFFILPVNDQISAWCSLIGVPSGLTPGIYTLTCRMENEEGSQVFQKKIGLTTREFPTEELMLNKSLTTIRTMEDPLKTAQAQELWSVFSSFESSHIYHTDTIDKPMAEHRTTTWFGTKRVYIYSNGDEAQSIHNGIDWAGPTGTPVSAVGSGRIVMADERIVTGNTIILELLPGVLMVYYHLDELLVKEGDMVEMGQVIGKLGMTGLATGPHLHWEMRISKVAVDPLPYLVEPLIDKTLILNIINNTL